MVCNLRDNLAVKLLRRGEELARARKYQKIFQVVKSQEHTKDRLVLGRVQFVQFVPRASWR